MKSELWFKDVEDNEYKEELIEYTRKLFKQLRVSSSLTSKIDVYIEWFYKVAEEDPYDYLLGEFYKSNEEFKVAFWQKYFKDSTPGTKKDIFELIYEVESDDDLASNYAQALKDTNLEKRFIAKMYKDIEETLHEY